MRPGKISEISEATASSSIAPAERVNFHIGNPVQNEQLTLYYLRTALGLKINGNSLEKLGVPSLRSEIGWNDNSDKRIQLLYNLIKKSAPYSPRGGFNINNIIPLVKRVHNWLKNDQDDLLLYDTGEKSGKRELIISSGGIEEALRVFFHSLNKFFVHLPAKIFFTGCTLPLCCKDFTSLKFEVITEDESCYFDVLEKNFKEYPGKPVFLFIGKILHEETRRKLRYLSYDQPLFFVEINDAPNHNSLAREAKLKNRVLRILTPSFLSDRLKYISVVFLAGNSEFLKVFESIHFQLKGTPSSSEIEMLQYISENIDEISVDVNSDENIVHSGDVIETENDSYLRKLSAFNKGSLVDRINKTYQDKIEKLTAIAERIEKRSIDIRLKNIPIFDK